MKKIVALFFLVHLTLIFFQGLLTTIDGYWIYHHNKIPDLSIFNLLKQNKHTELYYQIAGINTGYGFYGIKASSEKFFRIKFFDSLDRELKSDRYFNFSTTNGISRLKGYASFLANYIADTKTLIESDTLSTVSDPSVLQLRENYQFRKDYVEKAFKWLGKRNASLVSDCKSYKIELLTIVPENVWYRKNRKTKPKLYVIQEGLFPVQ